MKGRWPMSTFDYIANSLNVKGNVIKKCIHSEQQIEFIMELNRAVVQCPNCHAKTDRIKDYRWQRIAIGSILHQQAFVRLHKRRYVCPCCGRTFFETVPFLQRYQRKSKDLQMQIMVSCFQKRSFTDIAADFHTSTTTVIRYFDRLHFPHPQHLPQVLAMDEFRGNAHGQKYQVSITDVEHNELIDILPRRDADWIIRYFLRYPKAERRRVRYVVMDMSALFRSVYKTMFPNATLIADRFHVQRLVLWAMERVRKDIQNTFPKTSPYLKHNKRILQKRGTTLSGEELVKLRCIPSQSDELRRAYILKEAFYKVLRQKTELAAKRELNKWLAMVMGYNLDAFKGILRSFKDWEAAIIQAIIQPYSNGFTEGCNNLIKTVKRVAFGMRDFNRFRNRILYVNWQKRNSANALPSS